jgi:hypothetical protein
MINVFGGAEAVTSGPVIVTAPGARAGNWSVKGADAETAIES